MDGAISREKEAAREIALESVFSMENVASVYLGKPNCCMCGCSGNYAYTSNNAEYSGKDRGYALDDDDIRDRIVKARLKRFNADEQEPQVIDGYIFTKVIGNRQITVYLKRK